MDFDLKRFDEISNEIIQQTNNIHEDNATITTEYIEGISPETISSSGSYTKNELDMVKDIIIEKINLKRFDIIQLSNFVQDAKNDLQTKYEIDDYPIWDGFKEGFNRKKRKKKTKTERQIKNTFYDILSSFGRIAEDTILFIITLLIVMCLKFRSLIKTEHLYPSNPGKFPYIFYDDNCKNPTFEGCQGISSGDSESANTTNVIFKPVIHADTKGDELKKTINKEGLDEHAVFIEGDQSDSFSQKTKVDYINNSFPIDSNDGINKIDTISKYFMKSVNSKNRDELGTFEMILYTLHNNLLNSNYIVGCCHDILFKHLTLSTRKWMFGLAIILIFSFLKSYYIIANRAISRIRGMMFSSTKSNSTVVLTTVIKVISLLLIPFIAFFLFLFPFFYIISLMSSFLAYKDFNNFANSFFFTKINCYAGMIYSLFALLSAILVILLVGLLIFSPQSYKNIKNRMGKKTPDAKKSEEPKKSKKSTTDSAKVQKLKGKKTQLNQKKKMNQDKIKEQKDARKKCKKKKNVFDRKKCEDKYDKRINRNKKREGRKKDKIKKVKGKIKRNKKKKKKKRRQGFETRESFASKGCEGGPSSMISGIFSALLGGMGLAAFGLLGPFLIIPFVLPFISSFISTIKLAANISFGFKSIWGDMNNVLTNNKNIIVLCFVLLLIADQFISYFSSYKEMKKLRKSSVIINMISYFAIVAVLWGVLSSMKPSSLAEDSTTTEVADAVAGTVADAVADAEAGTDSTRPVE